MRRATVIAVALVLLAALPAVGQRLIREPTPAPAPPADTSTPWSVRDLLDARVRFRDGRALGRVSDLLLDRRGNIEFLVVRSDDGLVPVPWDVLLYDARQRTLTVLTRPRFAQLRQLTFREERRPDFSSPHWLRTVTTVWGTRGERPQLRYDTRPVDRGGDYWQDRFYDQTTPGPRPADLLRDHFDAFRAPVRRPPLPPPPPLPPLHSSVAGWRERALWAR